MSRQGFQTIAWFNDLHRRKRLNLDPPYQRRSVWNQSYKDRFIETILLAFPAPALFLYEEITAAGEANYHVVDGKQRLLSIFDFIDGAYPVAEDTEVQSLRGQYFGSLPAEVKTRFWTYQFTVHYLATNDESLLKNIFDRLNRNVAKLSEQELRHARYDGAFITAAESVAKWMAEALPGFPRIVSSSRAQMKDVEVVSNLLAFMEIGTKGLSQADLDRHYAERDESWDGGEGFVEEFRKIVEWIGEVVREPIDTPLSRTRFQNQADFYSLFGAAVEIARAGSLPTSRRSAERLSRLASYADDEVARESLELVKTYWQDARSASNDPGPRRRRIDLIKAVLSGAHDDLLLS